MPAYTLITGATSGIGQELAIELSKSRDVILLGRSTEKLEKTFSFCAGLHDIKTIACDLNGNKDILCDRLTDFMKEQNIQIEAFAHCAGVTKIFPIKMFPTSAINEIFNVNLFSAVEIIKALLKKFNHASLKNIIFISALWSIRGEIANSVYASSKGAINSLVYSLAKELAPKVRVNAVLPGAVVTPMTEDLINGEIGQKQLADYPLGFGKPEDVVNIIKFLLSENARWITGQTISVDGGRSIL